MAIWKEKVSHTYAIRVLLENFFTIMDKDNEAIAEDEKTLGDILDDFPFIEKVEYDGHFGSIIFITQDVRDDKKENWLKIEKAIKDYIGSEVI